METFSSGWEIPVVIALTAMMLFFAGCMFMFAIYCTALLLIRKFPVTPVIIFWVTILVSAVLSTKLNIESGIFFYTVSTPFLAAVFWYYERKHRLSTGQSEILVAA